MKLLEAVVAELGVRSYLQGRKVTWCAYDAWPDTVSAKNELSKTPLNYIGARMEKDAMIADIIGAE
eukprot:1884640-Ditylum_brightwellii.AAC.1